MGSFPRIPSSRARLIRRLRLGGLISHFAACFGKLAGERCSLGLRLVKRTALLLGTRSHRLSRSAELLSEGDDLLLFLLQRGLRVGGGCLRGDLLL